MEVNRLSKLGAEASAPDHWPESARTVPAETTLMTVSDRESQPVHGMSGNSSDLRLSPLPSDLPWWSRGRSNYSQMNNR